MWSKISLFSPNFDFGAQISHEIFKISNPNFSYVMYRGETCPAKCTFTENFNSIENYNKFIVNFDFLGMVIFRRKNICGISTENCVLCSFDLKKDPIFRICAIRMDLRVKSDI